MKYQMSKQFKMSKRVMGVHVDPSAVFFKGFRNSIQPVQVRSFFYSRGFVNHVIYKRVNMNTFRLYLALKFNNSDVAQDVCNKFNKTLIFGFQVNLSIFIKRSNARVTINNPFMQDRLRKLRAQATHRPFFYKKRFYGNQSPARSTFTGRQQRQRSRSTSTDSDRSQVLERTRTAQGRDDVDRKQHGHHSRSRSHSSQSTVRSVTPSRYSASPSNSKQSSIGYDKPHNQSHGGSSLRKGFCHSSKRHHSSREHPNHSKKRKKRQAAPVDSPSSKDQCRNSFSPVSFASDDEDMLSSPTTDSLLHITKENDPSGEMVDADCPTIKQEEPEAWLNSDEDATLNIRTPSSPWVAQRPRRPSQTATDPNLMAQPWRLKPLTIQDGGRSSVTKPNEQPSFSKSPTKQDNAPYHAADPPARTQLHQSPDTDWSSTSSHQLHSPTSSSFQMSPPNVNGLSRKQGRPAYVSAPDVHQENLVRLRAKKDDIIKAYKQDCDTFATVVRMLIRKDPDLEERLQEALRENLTEIGQKCVQELEEAVDQLRG